MEQRFDDFLSAVSQKSLQADVTWQSILRSFLFTEEAARINAFLNEHSSDYSLEKRRQIRLAIQMNEC